MHIYAPQALLQERRAHHWRIGQLQRWRRSGAGFCGNGVCAVAAHGHKGAWAAARKALVGRRRQGRMEKKVLLALAAGRTGPSGPTRLAVGYGAAAAEGGEV